MLNHSTSRIRIPMVGPRLDVEILVPPDPDHPWDHAERSFAVLPSNRPRMRDLRSDQRNHSHIMSRTEDRMFFPRRTALKIRDRDESRRGRNVAPPHQHAETHSRLILMPPVINDKQPGVDMYLDTYPACSLFPLLRGVGTHQGARVARNDSS